MAPAADPFAIDTNPLQRTPRAAGVTTATSGFPGKLTVSQVPFQPWSRALYAFRAENQLEPHIRCKPSGGTRQFGPAVSNSSTYQNRRTSWILAGPYHAHH
jgi:hypothetical protein